jgi:sialic acid synthase SpsE
LHTFTAADTAAFAHGVTQIEHHLGVRTAKREPDDVVDLHLAAGTLATVALNAGVQVDRHRGM